MFFLDLFKDSDHGDWTSTSFPSVLVALAQTPSLPSSLLSQVCWLFVVDHASGPFISTLALFAISIFVAVLPRGSLIDAVFCSSMGCKDGLI